MAANVSATTPVSLTILHMRFIETSENVEVRLQSDVRQYFVRAFLLYERAELRHLYSQLKHRSRADPYAPNHVTHRISLL